ncbi:MAG: NADH:ubiquinone reductase (Na(+)-transporting) subunit D [Flavobacteriales bacterium]|nr:NADH:ubiquinone reductase (Na(+)-transporting) subunit D [Flavobacteriales bacterium]
MSTETIEKTKEVKAKEPFLTKKDRKLVTNPLDSDNPITVQVLGVCSALAVTVAMKPTLVMALAVTFVVVMANVVISMLRKTIPNRIRIIVQLVVVASLVAVVDQVLQAYVYDVSKQLSVFVGLIITNCIVMGRLEAFALGNPPKQSALDGLGNSMGYAWIILTISFFRELFGSGKLFGATVLSKDWYIPNGVLMTPAGACILLGILIWVVRSRNGIVED